MKGKYLRVLEKFLEDQNNPLKKGTTKPKNPRRMTTLLKVKP